MMNKKLDQPSTMKVLHHLNDECAFFVHGLHMSCYTNTHQRAIGLLKATMGCACTRAQQLNKQTADG